MVLLATLTMIAEIMSNPEFGEVCYLIAVILFVIETLLLLFRPPQWTWSGVLVAAGLAFVALGLLAQTTVPAA